MAAADLTHIASCGTNAEWYAATGNCGGCGFPGCHDGPCVDHPGGWCVPCEKAGNA